MANSVSEKDRREGVTNLQSAFVESVIEGKLDHFQQMVSDRPVIHIGEDDAIRGLRIVWVVVELLLSIGNHVPYNG